MILKLQELVISVYHKGLKEMISDIPKRGRKGVFGKTTMFTFFLGHIVDVGRKFTVTLSRKEDGKDIFVILHAICQDNETLFFAETVNASAKEWTEMVDEVISIWSSMNTIQEKEEIFAPAENIEICWT